MRTTTDVLKISPGFSSSSSRPSVAWDTRPRVIARPSPHAPRAGDIKGLVPPSSPSPGPTIRALTQARLCLLGTSALWGTYAVGLRLLYTAGGPPLPSPFVTAARFQFITLYAMGLLFVRRRFSARRGATAAAGAQPQQSVFRPAMIRAGVELSIIGFTGNILSTWSVTRVQAVMTEVVLGTVHLFVPLLTMLLGATQQAKHVGSRTWLGCALSFAAVGVLALRGARSATAAAAVNPNWAAACAPFALIASSLLYATGRVRAQHYIVTRGFDSEQLNSVRCVMMGGLSLGVLLASAALPGGDATRHILANPHTITGVQWALLGLSTFISAFGGSMLQFRAQTTVSAANAQPFLALQPLFAALWSWLFLANEPIEPALLIGGSVVVIGALLASTDRSAVVHRPPHSLDAHGEVTPTAVEVPQAMGGVEMRTARAE